MIDRWFKVEEKSERDVLCFFMLYKLAQLCLFRELNRRQRLVILSSDNFILGSRTLTRNQFTECKNYMLERLKADDCMRGLNVLLYTIFLYCSGPRLLWSASGIVCSVEFCRSVVFAILLNTLYTLALYPIKYYILFTIETHFGFNRQTRAEFNTSCVTDYVAECVGLLPQIGLLEATCRWTGAPLGGAAIHVFLGHLLPALIGDDLFPSNRRLLVEFPQGQLKDSAQELARRMDVPFDKINIIQASLFTSHIYAFTAGYCSWQRRILLFDNLVNGVTSSREEMLGVPRRVSFFKRSSWRSDSVDSPARSSMQEENDFFQDSYRMGTVPDPPSQSISREGGLSVSNVLGILAHEMAHWKFNHPAKLFLMEAAFQFIKFFCYLLLLRYTNVYEIFDIHDEEPAIIGYIAGFKLLLQPMDNIFNVLIKLASRNLEIVADKVAGEAGLGEGLRGCLEKMVVKNLQFPKYDPLYEALSSYHPSIIQRINSLNAAR